MMRSYMQRLYDSVDFSIDAVRRRSDWPAWRKRTLADLRRSLGLERFPPRTPLRARVVGVSDRDGYVLERVVFETRPGFLMTANLYRPKHLAGRVPAVLCVHGHTMKGKTSEAMQVRSINYARAGWVALALDATGHGERVHIGHRRTFAIVTAGMTLEGVQVWDNMRGIDYLRSRPEVDPERIGITGCSGGGNQTMYTAAMDERIAVAVPVCSVSTLRGQIFTPNGIGCQCECIPDLMRYGLENAVVCALIAPRPLLILAGALDRTFPVQHTRVANRHLERFYRAIGHADRYGYVERRLPHGYRRAFRELAHGWFDRWFNARRKQRAWTEPSTEIAPPEDLWCFPRGRLPSDSATLGSVAHEVARGLVAGLKVPTSPAGRAKLRRRIRDEVLGGFPPRAGLDARQTAPVRRGGVLRRRVELPAEEGITIRARIAAPAWAEGPVPCLIRVRRRPVQAAWKHTKAMVDLGLAVAELDTRPLDGDEHVSRAALVLGRPLVGMGAYDITRLVDYLQGLSDIDGGRCFLWAEGLMSLPAAYAVALDERIAGAVLGGLVSTYVAPQPVQHPTWTFARGLLRLADVEHLLALAAPRPLVIANPVGPDLKHVPPGRLGRVFRAARAAYGRGGRLRILGGDDSAVVRAARQAGILPKRPAGSGRSRRAAS